MIFMDADGSHNPRFPPQLWAERERADLVIASRYVRGGKTENPAVLIFLSLMVNVVFRSGARPEVLRRIQHLRLYRGDALRRLELKCDNFDIIEEILIKLSYSNRVFVSRKSRPPSRNARPGRPSADCWRLPSPTWLRCLGCPDSSANAKASAEEQIMNYLITGGCGFLGSNIAAHLLDAASRWWCSTTSPGSAPTKIGLAAHARQREFRLRRHAPPK